MLFKLSSGDRYAGEGWGLKAGCLLSLFPPQLATRIDKNISKTICDLIFI